MSDFLESVRQALEVHDHMCELFDRYMVAESQETVDGLRVAIFDKFVNGGEEAMHGLADAAGRLVRLAETVDIDELREVIDTDRCQPHGDGHVLVRRDHHNVLWRLADTYLEVHDV